jgi:hypothetical protein
MSAAILIFSAILTAYAWHQFRMATPVLAVVAFNGLLLTMAIIGGIRNTPEFGRYELVAFSQGAILGTLAYAVVPAWYRAGVSFGEKISAPD